jgi:hypothetical protein
VEEAREGERRSWGDQVTDEEKDGKCGRRRGQQKWPVRGDRDVGVKSMLKCFVKK